MKDAIETMGKILPSGVKGRDAVHVAVFSAFSYSNLIPGQEVALSDTDIQDHIVVPTSVNDVIGIVDPFLKGNVPSGDRFWVYVMPRTITGLSHEWSHPSFDNVSLKEQWADPNFQHTVSLKDVFSVPESEQWLRDYINTNDCPDYETLLTLIKKINTNGNQTSWDEEYLHIDGFSAAGDISDEFWENVEIVLGTKLTVKPKYFSCSC